MAEQPTEPASASIRARGCGLLLAVVIISSFIFIPPGEWTGGPWLAAFFILTVGAMLLANGRIDGPPARSIAAGVVAAACVGLTVAIPALWAPVPAGHVMKWGDTLATRIIVGCMVVALCGAVGLVMSTVVYAVVAVWSRCRRRDEGASGRAT